MPSEWSEWVEAPRNDAFERMFDPAEKLFASGQQLRETAMKLHDEGKAEKRRDIWGQERLPLISYSILAPVLQALAAEYLPRGLATRDQESYVKTHNLHCLYADLEPAIRDRAALVEVSDIRTKLLEFLEGHRNDFVEWRYDIERRSASTHHVVFDRTLEGLIAAFNP